MDPSSTGGLAHMEQYGALGIMAVALLTLFVMLFRQFVNHLLQSNQKLQEALEAQNEGHQKAIKEQSEKNLAALLDIANTLRELRTDVGMVFNEVGGSRPYRVAQDRPERTNPGAPIPSRLPPYKPPR